MIIIVFVSNCPHSYFSNQYIYISLQINNYNDSPKNLKRAHKQLYFVLSSVTPLTWTLFSPPDQGPPVLPDGLLPHAQDVEAGGEAAGDGNVADLDQVGLFMIHNPQSTESNLRGKFAE